MTKWRIPLYRIFWDDEDVQAVTDVIQRGMFWTGGPSVTAFEKEIADFVNKKHAVAFNSGTSGLFALMQSLNLKPSDEVIVPSFTFIATCNSVVNAGAIPVFAEIEPESFGLNPHDVEQRITSHTKVILPIHYGGCPCRIEELRDIANENNIILVEDAAESIGSIYRGIKVGGFGEASMFSFCGNKIISTGEGGVIVTDNESLEQKLRLIQSHGRTDKGDYFKSSDGFDYIMLGNNWRMSDIIAELGRSQFKKLERVSQQRREVADIYQSSLEDLQLTLPRASDNCSHVYQMYTVLFDNQKKREEVRNHLTSKGIMTKVYFDCVHLTKFYMSKFKFNYGLLPVTEDISKRVLTLPIYPRMSHEDIDFVCKQVRYAMKL